MTAMNDVQLEKVTVNIGVGQGGQPLENAKKLLEQLTGAKAIQTLSRTRNPTFNLRKGEPIGVKVTLRGTPAVEFVKKALVARENKVARTNFDRTGNVAFGVPEYIDFPGMKYQPEIGILGFDVCLTLEKPGTRIKRRKIAPRSLPKKQRVSTAEAEEFMKKTFGINVV
ncbi:50S ribosomal protein L5 [Candidatus Micrarchaeota archaeon]|nr:50S ribosomal protein L5 [Candidatus Micrarchaeota archaeon]